MFSKVFCVEGGAEEEDSVDGRSLCREIREGAVQVRKGLLEELNVLFCLQLYDGMGSAESQKKLCEISELYI